MSDSPRVSIDREIHNRDAAILAADEEGTLITTHDIDDHRKQVELANWIGEILGESLSPDTLFDDLDNGVRLLYLAKSVQLIKCNHLKDAKYEKAVEDLKPDEYTNIGRLLSRRASQIAKKRSNIAKFLEWCSEIGVPRITLFETEDLTHRKNLRQVTTCLFYVSKIASRFGIEPPSSVKDELNVEQAEANARDELSDCDSFAMLHSSARTSNDFVENQTADDLYKIPTLFNEEEEMAGEDGSIEQNSVSTISFDDAYPAVHYQRSTSPIAFLLNNNDDNELLESNENLEQDPPSNQSPIPRNDNIRMATEDEFLFRPLQYPATRETAHLDKNAVAENRQSPRQTSMPRYKVSRLLSEDSLSNEIGIYQRHSSDRSPDFIYYESPLHDVRFADGALDDSELPRPLTPPPTVGPYIYLTSFDDIKEITRPRSPFSLPRVPADIIEQSMNDDDSSDECVTDQSYEFPAKKTYADVATGSDEVLTKDIFDYVADEEIMIDFPPYFELSDLPKQFPIISPPLEYIVAPVGDGALYAVPNKSRTRSRQQNRNAAFEMDVVATPERPDTGYHSLDTSYVRRWRDGTDIPTTSAPFTMPRAAGGREKIEAGTQTFISFTGGVEHILEGTSSNRENDGPLVSRRNDPGQTVLYKSHLQRTLPTTDDDISITQASDLEASRTARWGSANSSSRIRGYPRNVDAKSAPSPAIRRGVLRRTSSRISQQLRKAAFAAKKYTKRTVLVAILIVLALGALAAMLAVFLTR